MLHDRFPGLPADGLTATFSRADALAHEDRAYLTWEHPMVRGAMEMLTSGDLGDAALTVVSHPDFRPGTPLLELLYLVECAAPAELGAGRFLPPTCIRLLLDARGVDRAAELSHEVLQGQCLLHKRRLAETLLKTLAGTLRQLFERGAAQAEEASRRIVDSALAEMRQQLGDELARLRGLAAVNPSVRDDELERLEARRALLAEHMDNARVRLDAARVVVMQ
jgi:ATP-dependent helicase HepA